MAHRRRIETCIMGQIVHFIGPCNMATNTVYVAMIQYESKRNRQTPAQFYMVEPGTCPLRNAHFCAHTFGAHIFALRLSSLFDRLPTLHFLLGSLCVLLFRFACFSRKRLSLVFCLLSAFVCGEQGPQTRRPFRG